MAAAKHRAFNNAEASDNQSKNAGTFTMQNACPEPILAYAHFPHAHSSRSNLSYHISDFSLSP
jgi:hypothetical protein